MNLPRISLHALPDELVQSILLHLQPEDLASLQLTSKRFLSLCDEPLIWRHFCKTEYGSWRDTSVRAALHGNRNERSNSQLTFSWKEIFVKRRGLNKTVRNLMDQVLSQQQGRMSTIGKIIELGYDTKDELVDMIHTPADASDVLARRYWSRAALGAIHRRLAVDTWTSATAYEDALAGYDMFVVDGLGFEDGEEGGDIYQIQSRLDEIAKDVSSSIDDWDMLNLRQRALQLVTYVREHNLTGVADQANYHQLRNSFLGLALFSEDHESLPLTSAVIYCALARRLGLDASPSDFPLHVHVVLHSPPGTTFDGRPAADETTRDTMFLDPFRSSSEVLQEELASQLTLLGYGASSPSYSTYFEPIELRNLVIRQGRNILNSVHLTEEGTISNRLLSSQGPSLNDAFYAALWGMTLLDTPSRARNFLPHLLRIIQETCPMDLPLLTRSIVPFYRNVSFYDRLRNYIEEIQYRDLESIEPRPRLRRDPAAGIVDADNDTQRGSSGSVATADVKFRIGQVFQHKRYGYEAVIVGWDRECKMHEDWIAQMQVDALPGGRLQGFYHVLASDKSRRYVAEENISIVYSEPSVALMRLAGQYFKRWDSSLRHFVSNIRDQYPDD